LEGTRLFLLVDFDADPPSFPPKRIGGL